MPRRGKMTAFISHNALRLTNCEFRKAPRFSSRKLSCALINQPGITRLARIYTYLFSSSFLLFVGLFLESLIRKQITQAYRESFRERRFFKKFSTKNVLINELILEYFPIFVRWHFKQNRWTLQFDKTKLLIHILSFEYLKIFVAVNFNAQEYTNCKLKELAIVNFHFALQLKRM